MELLKLIIYYMDCQYCCITQIFSISSFTCKLNSESMKNGVRQVKEILRVRGGKKSLKSR